MERRRAPAPKDTIAPLRRRHFKEQVRREVRATQRLDSALLKQARSYAKRTGLTWNDFAEGALRAHLEVVDPDGKVDPDALADEPEKTVFVVVPDELVKAEGDADYDWQR